MTLYVDKKKKIPAKKKTYPFFVIPIKIIFYQTNNKIKKIKSTLDYKIIFLLSYLIVTVNRNAVFNNQYRR